MDRLSASNQVGPSGNFVNSAKIAGSLYPIAAGGNFAPGDTGFIGLKFDISGSTHYGWANITLNSDYTVALNALAMRPIRIGAAHMEAAGTRRRVLERSSGRRKLRLLCSPSARPG